MAWRGAFSGGDRLAALLAAALCLAAAVAAAGEPMLARVLSIGPDTVDLEVQGGNGGRLRVPLSGTELPRGLVPGSLVRVWPDAAGDSAAGSEGGAMAGQGGVRLAPLGRAGLGQDRTGVRSRLGRGTARGLGPGWGGDGGRGGGGGRGGR